MLKRTAIFILIVAGALFLAASAGAHHMRSQPHYGYAENYPQTPTKETRAHILGYDVTVVTYFFEGLRRERSDTPDDVQFYISLADPKTHQSYTGPLSITILHKGRQIASFDHARPLEEAVYRIRQAVPGPGQYEMRLTAGKSQGKVFVDVEGKEVSNTPYIIAGIAALLAALFLLNRRRIHFGRRRNIRVAPGA